VKNGSYIVLPPNLSDIVGLATLSPARSSDVHVDQRTS
jgi:hypothetical protein